MKKISLLVVVAIFLNSCAYFKIDKKDSTSTKNPNRTENTYYEEKYPEGKITYVNGKKKVAIEYGVGDSITNQTLYDDNGEKVLYKDYRQGGNFSLMMEIEMKNNKRNGKYRSYYSNGTLMEEGRYKENRIYGEHRKYHRGGGLKSINDSRYKNEKWVSKPEINFDEKGKLLNGLYEQYDEKKELVRQTNYKDGLKEGIDKYYSNGKLIITTPYVNGFKNGIKKFHYESGGLYKEESYKDDKLDGVTKKYLRNKYEIHKTYQNGEIIIERTAYDENHNLLEGKYNNYFYVAGQVHGIMKSYHKDGSIKKETPYVRGFKEGIAKEYFEDGTLKLEKEFRKSKSNGLEKKFYKDGTLMKTTLYEDSKIIGVQKWYYGNGNLQMEIPHKNDMINGTKKVYNKDGSLKEKIIYKDDEEVE